MQNISYEHALDKNDRLITTDVGERGGYYICPNCRQRLIFRAGAIRQWHFAHKGQSCDPETYLHQAAKLALGQELQKRTSSNQSFHVLARGLVHFVERGTAQLVSSEYTHQFSPNDILVGQPVISIEARHNGFIPDILLSSPLQIYFIEICVTSPVSEDKIASGTPIIELKIESEADISTLIQGNLREGSHVRLYNFDSLRTLEERILEPKQVPTVVLPKIQPAPIEAPQPLLGFEPSSPTGITRSETQPRGESKYLPIRFGSQVFPSRVRHLYFKGNDETLNLSRTPNVEVEGLGRKPGREVTFRFSDTIEEISKLSENGSLIVVYIDKVT